MSRMVRRLGFSRQEARQVHLRPDARAPALPLPVPQRQQVNAWAGRYEEHQDLWGGGNPASLTGDSAEGHSGRRGTDTPEILMLPRNQLGGGRPTRTVSAVAVSTDSGVRSTPLTPQLPIVMRAFGKFRLKWWRHWHDHDVFFYASNPRRVLSGNTQRQSLCI
jgi:hypothetical protein